MIHTENFILVDPEKRIRGFYDGTDTQAMETLLSDIQLLKKEYPTPNFFELTLFTKGISLLLFFKIILNNDSIG